MNAGAPLTLPPGADLVLFDGSCGLCRGAVAWLQARDRGGRLRFAQLQGELAARLLPGADPGTLHVLVAPGTAGERHLVRAAALAHLLGRLPFPWRLGAALRFLPRTLRDGLYRWVARRRHALAAGRPGGRAPGADPLS